MIAALECNDAFVTLAPPGGFKLKHGGLLRSVRIVVTFYGREHEQAPTILVCHALTGNSRVAEWWGDVIGPGKLLDTERFRIVCTNALGSCYGSTGPGYAGPGAEPLGERFPVVTVEDMVRVQREALEILGIRRLALAIGGSIGGQQAMQWAAVYPEAIRGIVAIGATGRLSPMGIGLNSIARQAIRIDPAAGLRVARMVGMLSYKSAGLLWKRHGRKGNRGEEDPGASLWSRFDIEGYLQHQGDKLAGRMDPTSFLYLTKAMDLYELDPAGWSVPALLIGIESDWLYPPEEVEFTATQLAPHARFAAFASDHGHDGFLADAEQLTSIVRPFLEEIIERQA